MSDAPIQGGRARAIVRLLCPVCGVGKVFRGTFAMNVRCPNCGTLFGRGEPGYFLGAMYFSYGIGIIVITAFTGVVYLIRPSWRLWQMVGAAWIAFLPLVPLVYRYSRVLWLHFDRAIDPDD
jgi:uncharacterized protein (DUF983 family)